MSNDLGAIGELGSSIELELVIEMPNEDLPILTRLRLGVRFCGIYEVRDWQLNPNWTILSNVRNQTECSSSA